MSRPRQKLARYSALRMLGVGALVLGLAALCGCGTTRSSDTVRTATEQLLISDAIDQAVQTVDFGSLSGQSVYLDDSRLKEVVDKDYLISTLRQHLLSSGCALRDKRADAEFIVEARAGAVGTDRNDLLFGVPSMNVPQIMPLQPIPAAIPEIPFAKRRDQRGIVKLAVFAYHRETGMPVWQSGLAQLESSSNDVWILGAGPFQRGTVSGGTVFAGEDVREELPGYDPLRGRRRSVDLAREAKFLPAAKLANLPPQRLPGAAPSAAPPSTKSPDDGVVQASHAEPARADATPPAPRLADPASEPREPRLFSPVDAEPIPRKVWP